MKATVTISLQEYESLKEINKSLLDGLNIVTYHYSYGKAIIEYRTDSELNKILLEQNKIFSETNSCLKNENLNLKNSVSMLNNDIDTLKSRKWYELLFSKNK